MTFLLCVLELLLFRSVKDHRDRTAFVGRILFDFRVFPEDFLHAGDDLETDFHVSPFTSTEENRHLDLVALIEKLTNAVAFCLQIAFVGLGPNFDLFQLDDLLLLLGFFGFLGHFILVLTKIHKTTDGW
jgi:hypothetical protein